MLVNKAQSGLGSTTRETPLQMVSQSRVAGVVSATFSTDNNQYVLDFGNINKDTIDFFGNFACQYDVIDLYSKLLENNIIQSAGVSENPELAQSDDKDAEQRFDKFEQQIKDGVSNYGVQKYDAIFLWDLLNYLDAWQVKRFFKLLKPLCHRKTNILAIFPIGKQISRKPFLCSIFDYDKIKYKRRPGGIGMIKNPEHDKSGFGELFKDFELSHSSLSKNGLKECLLVVKR